MSWIEVQAQYHDVVVSTYGRGLWVLRDITRLEQADQVNASMPIFLYAPRPGFREGRSGSAEFLYTLKDAGDRVTIEILDGVNILRKFDGPARAGLNRATWDLRYDPPLQVALRTIPPDNPHIWEEARFKGQTTRTIQHWGIQQAVRVGPLAAPGKYTVRVTIPGINVGHRRPFEVIKDPDIAASADDLAASVKAQIRIRDGLNSSAAMINRLEIMRKQIEDLLKANAGKKPVEQALRDLDRKMMDVELKLITRTEMHSDDKWYVEAYKVYMNLVWLNGVMGTGAGDVAGGADFRPTDSSMRVLEMLEKDLAAAQAAFAALVDKDVPAFNKANAGRKIVIDTAAK